MMEKYFPRDIGGAGNDWERNLSHPKYTGLRRGIHAVLLVAALFTVRTACAQTLTGITVTESLTY